MGANCWRRGSESAGTGSEGLGVRGCWKGTAGEGQGRVTLGGGRSREGPSGEGLGTGWHTHCRWMSMLLDTDDMPHSWHAATVPLTRNRGACTCSRGGTKRSRAHTYFVEAGEVSHHLRHLAYPGLPPLPVPPPPLSLLLPSP